MELLNATNMIASYTQGLDKTGRESLLVVIKGTFTLPLDCSVPQLCQQQIAPTEADEFSGEPGFSAALYESDYAPIKPRCDILLNGSAYAPLQKHTGERKAVTSINVTLEISSIKKTFNVLGNRVWHANLLGIHSSAAQPFNKQVISYDVAFGGIDDFHPDPQKKDAYMLNPIGKGFHKQLSHKLVDKTPLPNTEQLGKTITSPKGKYQPMAFGPIGRATPERVKHAGTYDQHWIDEIFPFLPDDFDNRYHQSAPQDQQCDYLVGGEIVKLTNLTETGDTSFIIPTIDVPVVFFRKKADNVFKQAVIDTLMIEPDKGIFSIVWRCSEPLKRNMFEIPQVLVGKKSKGWWRARELGKTYYPSLAHIGAGAEDD